MVVEKEKETKSNQFNKETKVEKKITSIDELDLTSFFIENPLLLTDLKIENDLEQCKNNLLDSIKIEVKKE